MTDRNFIAIQNELVAARRNLQILTGEYQKLSQEAQRLSQQGAQVEAEKVTALSWLLAVILEHHQGQVSVSNGLVTELMKGTEVYGTKMRLEGDRLHIAATDSKGNTVQQTSLDTTCAIRAVPKQEEPIIEKCDECGRQEPMHWPHCRKYPEIEG